VQLQQCDPDICQLVSSGSWLDEHPLPSDPADTRQNIISLFLDWDTNVLDLIKQSDDSPITSHKVYAFPPPHLWSIPLKGITLLGDVAHIMSHFAGEGVNLALTDAYELGRELVGAVRKGAQWNRLTKDLGFRLFEKVMWQKAGGKGEESLKNLNALFTVHALRLSSLMDLHQAMMCKVQ